MADLVRVSKFLSKHLRHDPAGLGLTLEVGGWVAVDVLLAACARRGMPISRELLAQVVAGSDKQRFAFDGAGLRIRANQGHSVEVDLQLRPLVLRVHAREVHLHADLVAQGLERLEGGLEIVLQLVGDLAHGGLVVPRA